jgi:hypothetical protein
MIYLIELFLFCLRGTSHSREFRIEAEIILECDRSKGARFLLDGDRFLCFYRLMESV